MAGDWIKFEIATSDKPEVWAIADALDIDPDAVVGKLLRVWAWFDQQTETGNALSVTKKLLDRSVGVTGFCEALVTVGWLEDDGETIAISNFDRHNGETAKKRALTAKRVAKHKRKANAKGNGDGNAGDVTSALPKEEKRRYKDSEHKCSSSNGRESPVTLDDITAVFRHWQTECRHQRAKLDDKRKKCIKKALALGYTVDDLCQAITGCCLTPFNQGENKQGQKYDDLSLILRDADHIDRFMRHAINPPEPKDGKRSNFDKKLADWSDERLEQIDAARRAGTASASH